MAFLLRDKVCNYKNEKEGLKIYLHVIYLNVSNVQIPALSFGLLTLTVSGVNLISRALPTGGVTEGPVLCSKWGSREKYYLE